MKVTVVSLTAAGRSLAERLRPILCDAEYLHRPQPFAASLQTRFQAGRRLLLICATGIAVRTLAPVLRDKHNDPAVLVLDEQGHFVIPLLAGHEGGANDWARHVGEQLGARCVITSARRYTEPVLVAGLGCERGCPQQVLTELAEHTLAEHDIGHGQLAAIASIDLKQDEAGLLALAASWRLPATFYPAAMLLAYSDRLSTKSTAVFRATGCYGVAEAAALAHAEHLSGKQAELLITKRKNQRATFAVARTYRDTPES